MVSPGADVVLLIFPCWPFTLTYRQFQSVVRFRRYLFNALWGPLEPMWLSSSFTLLDPLLWRMDSSSPSSSSWYIRLPQNMGPDCQGGYLLELPIRPLLFDVITAPVRHWVLKISWAGVFRVCRRVQRYWFNTKWEPLWTVLVVSRLAFWDPSLWRSYLLSPSLGTMYINLTRNVC